jgi:hypothetical protein
MEDGGKENTYHVPAPALHGVASPIFSRTQAFINTGNQGEEEGVFKNGKCVGREKDTSTEYISRYKPHTFFTQLPDLK